MAVIHSLRTTLTTYYLEKIGIKKSNDVTQDLIPHNIRRHSKNISKVLEVIDNCKNPFDNNSETEHSSTLLNIASG
jgi:glycine cleavage system pyridoxal-binding protein P